MASDGLLVLSLGLIWMIAAPVKTCEMPAYPSPEYPAYPSHGDLRLCPGSGDFKLVMIYMGSDGTNIESMWGAFSGSNYSSHKDVADTLCQQLGYDDGKIIRGNATEEAKGYPVWISDVTCPSSWQPRHILRCDHKFRTVYFNHEDDWYLSCSSFSTRLGPGYDENTYHGQIALIPPKGVVDFNYSRSLGVVTVREKDKFWKYIWNDSSLFDFNDADTACRAMGYTHAVKNSVTTVEQYTTAYGENYSFDMSLLSSHPASRINCTESSQCIGCCGNFSFQSEKLPTLVTNDKYAIVIRCSFYKPASRPPVHGGYKEICEIVGSNGSIRGEHVCPPGEPAPKMFSNTILIIAATIPVSIAVLFLGTVVIVLVILLCLVTYKWKHRPRYDALQRNVNLDDEDEGGGGGRVAAGGEGGGEGGGDGGGEGGAGDRH